MYLPDDIFQKEVSRRLNREYTVIKEKHRAGQLRRQNSLRFWISGTGLRIPSHRNLDFVLQSLARFQIPWVGFRIPKPRVRIPKGKVSWIPDFTSKSFLDSGILITSLWADQLLVYNLYTTAMASMWKSQGENFTLNNPYKTTKPTVYMLKVLKRNFRLLWSITLHCI